MKNLKTYGTRFQDLLGFNLKYIINIKKSKKSIFQVPQFLKFTYNQVRKSFHSCSSIHMILHPKCSLKHESLMQMSLYSPLPSQFSLKLSIIPFHILCVNRNLAPNNSSLVISKTYKSLNFIYIIIFMINCKVFSALIFK